MAEEVIRRSTRPIKKPTDREPTLTALSRLNLEQIKTIKILDENPNSVYFQIFELKEEDYGLGRHSFVLYGSDLLKKETDIAIEILDADGQPIITRGVQDDGVIPGWRVWFDITKAHAAGLATIYVAGVAEEFAERAGGDFNVLWQRKIAINPKLPNKSPIVLRDPPGVVVQEVIESDDDQPIKQRSYAAITASNLETYSGRVQKIEVYAISSGAKPTEENWKLLTTEKIPDSSDSSSAEYIDTYQFKVQVPTEREHDTLRLKTVLLNPADEPAMRLDSGSAWEATSSYVTFEGAQTYALSASLVGDGMLTGSLYLSNDRSSGIVMGESSGASAGLIRSVGYSGYWSGVPGFMIWSGSVLTSTGYNYDGVGLELYGSPTSSLRYSTLTEQLEVTGSIIALSGHFWNTFTVGSSSVGIVISGSDGYETIHSQNWDRNNPENQGWAISGSGEAWFRNANISGSISASVGWLGGWVIESEGIRSQGNNIFLSGSGVISSSNFYVDESGNITGSSALLDGILYVTGTGTIANFVLDSSEIRSTNNNLQLKSSGQITGSDVLFTAGSIAGFDIATTGITSTGVGMHPSGQTYAFTAGSSNEFNVKHSGQITGSNVLFTGGTVGGFSLSQTAITGGNLILSSSGQINTTNFNVSKEGNLTASNAFIDGILSSSEGNIGGWTLGATTLVGANITMDATDSRIYKSDNNDKYLGYYIDFTPATSGNDYYIRFGPNFAVSSSGVLIASGAVIEGVVTASGGLIGGWTIGSGALYTGTNPNVVGMSSAGNTRFFAGATSLGASASAVFNVKENGDITGSSVLFTGGNIGGFSLTSTQLNSTNNNLLLKSSGQITGSNVLFTGGAVGGWTLSNSRLTGGNIILDSTGNIVASLLAISGSDSKITKNDDPTNYFLDFATPEFKLGNFFHLTSTSLSLSGSITASAGNIGGWEILAERLQSANNNVILSGSGVISSSNFYVSEEGNITGSSALFDGNLNVTGNGRIANWLFNATKIYNSDNTVELNSTNNGLFIKDSGGVTRVSVASQSMYDIGGEPDLIINDSFELTGSLNPGRNYNAAVTSWSLNLGGNATHSLTDRSAYENKDKAVSGNITLDIIVPSGSSNYTANNTYEFYQIVTGSFQQNNTISFRGVSRFSHSLGGSGYNRNLEEQYFRVEYLSASAWVPFLPVSYNTASCGFGYYRMGQGSYASFGASARLPYGTNFLRVRLSGSVNSDATASFTTLQHITDPQNSAKYTTYKYQDPKYPETELTWDQFGLKENEPVVQLLPDGLLIYNSEDSYIKMTAAGIDIRGGSGNSVFGSTVATNAFANDSLVAGSLDAPSLQAYEADPEDISTTPWQGNIGEYAMGNHRHDLPFSTLNTVIQEGTLSSIHTNDLTISGSLNYSGSGFEVSGALHVSSSDNSYFIGGGNVGIGTSSPSFSDWNTATGLQINGNDAVLGLHSTGGTGVDFQIGSSNTGKLIIYNNDLNKNLVSITGVGNVGIGTITPSAQFHVLKTSGAGYVAFQNISGTEAIYLMSSTNSYIGYDSSNSLHIGTANSVGGAISSKVMIDSSGNVGIGTTSPQALLHSWTSISGSSLDISSTIKAPSIGTGTDNSVIILNSSGYLKTDEINPVVWDTSATFVSSSNGTNNELAIYTSPTAIEGDSKLTFDGTGLNITGNVSASGGGYIMGNVGIGTSNPGYVLDINGDINIISTNRLRFNSSHMGLQWTTQANNDSIDVLGSGNVVGLMLRPNIRQIHFGSTTSSPYINNPSGTTYLSLMGGNIGIGTSNPTSLLELYSTGAHTVMTIHSATGWGSKLQFDESNSAHIQGHDGNGISTARSLSFAVGNVIYQTILNSGNIGIKTTTPSQTLDVSGSISILSGSANQLLLPQNNNVTSPTIAFGDGDTGFYEVFDDNLAISILGIKRYVINGTAIQSNTSLGFYNELASATSTNPVHAFVDDEDTGLGRAGANTGSLIAGGTNVLNWFGSGDVSIGSTAKIERLTIDGTNPRIFLDDSTAPSTTTNRLYSVSGQLYWNGVAITAAGSLPVASEGVTLRGNGSSWQTNTTLNVTSGSQVGIGTQIPNSKLHVYDDANAGSTIFRVEGSSGSLFNVTDSLSGSLLSCNDISGLPIFEVFSDDRVVMGSFNQNTLVVTGSRVGIGTSTPTSKLTIDGDIEFIGAQTLKTSNGSLTLDTGATSARVFIKSNGVTLIDAFEGTQDKVTIGGTGLDVDFQWFPTSGVGLFGQASSGNVGIGTTSPNALLHVDKGAVTVNPGLNADTAIFVGQANTNVYIGAQDSFQSRLYFADGSNFNIGGVVYDHSDDSMRFTINNAERIRIDSSGNVGIGTTSPQTTLHVNGTISGSALNINGTTTLSGNIIPSADNTYNLGSSTYRWNTVYSVNNITGGTFEVGLKTPGIGNQKTGTIVVWRNGKLIPCDKEGDPLAMGVIQHGIDVPIVMGAEPVLCTGKIDEGDYIITSKKIGHGKGIKPKYLLLKNLFGKIIAQALESKTGDSFTVKCMIRKM